MKGAINPDHMAINNYELKFLTFPVDLTPVEISGIEDELQTVELPDRTVASGGNRGPTEFTIMLPAHHGTEQNAMEVWYRLCQDPVLPIYKSIGTLILKSVSGQNLKTFQLLGAFPKKRATPDLEMANEGDMANIEWTFSIDDILPI